jgi:hypothetical protein
MNLRRGVPKFGEIQGLVEICRSIVIFVVWRGHKVRGSFTYTSRLLIEVHVDRRVIVIDNANGRACTHS